ncbi:MAG: aldo/keto reductase [Propionibacteriaceae bacterium]|jgi:methylglyoxal reductase|nr:aldo/keto reductase [Propionibacteriaceae bacterium]
MNHRIGRSDVYTTSRITLGAMGIGGGHSYPDQDDGEGIATIHRAHGLGINLIDSAPVYGLGHSEEVIGRAIRGRRDDFVLSTKATFNWDRPEDRLRLAFQRDGIDIYASLRPDSLRRDLEASLKRLGTDHVDIYYLHNPRRKEDLTPVADSAAALNAFKAEGKIRAIGLSNVTLEEIEDYQANGVQVDIVQRRYSILDRFVEPEILPKLERDEISFHAYTPLERGLLTGSVRADFQFADKDHRRDQVWWNPAVFPLALGFVDSLKEVAAKYGKSLTELAIAFLLARSQRVHVLVGARKPAQIDQDAGGEFDLAPKDVDWINQRWAGLEAEAAAAEKA